ncbi:MAG: adenylate kinase [Clostridiales bacterium]|jgi:adenylate kinase|nr:adenylate kinase [Clostridiales bacterium]
MRLVVLGAPGAGKGTQARNLARYYNTPHVSTGDLLRNQAQENNVNGRAVKSLIDEGKLVSDEIVARLIVKQIADGSFILDGYPRTLYQAGVLSHFARDLDLPLDRVISIQVPDEVIIERMAGRVYCARCGATYNTHYHPPVIKDKCDVCGGTLIQREDDKTLTVQKRLTLYHEMTEPIINFYKGEGLLLPVSGIGDIGDITAQIIAELGDQKEG